LKTTTCTNIDRKCTNDNVIETNQSNDNPDPNNKDYENEIFEAESSTSKTKTSKVVLALIWMSSGLLILKISFLCAYYGCCYCCCDGDDDDEYIPRYNNYTNERKQKTNIKKFNKDLMRKH